MPNDPPKSFTFDGVYGEDSTTEQIYNDIGFGLVEVSPDEWDYFLRCGVCRACWRDTMGPSLPTARLAVAKASLCRASMIRQLREESSRGHSNTSLR